MVFPASITELYAPNEYTSSGGIFSDSQALKTCHQNKLITGKCSPPCYDVVPGDPTGRCFVYSKDRECLCIDPCTLYSGKKLDPLYGSELKSSGDACERCVAHKSFSFFSGSGRSESPTRMNPTNRPKWVHEVPKGTKSFDISCGMCDTEWLGRQQVHVWMKWVPRCGVDRPLQKRIIENQWRRKRKWYSSCRRRKKARGPTYETYQQDQQPDMDKKKW